MMSKKLLFLLLGGGMLSAQTINETNAAGKTAGKTGINTNLPTRTLTIQNPPADQGKPVLRLADLPSYSQNVNSVMDPNLGGNAQSSTNYSDYRPLVIDEIGDVYLGNPIINNTGAITLMLDKPQGDWVLNLDTFINYDKYMVALMDYSFKFPDPKTGHIVMLTAGSNTPNKNVGGNLYDRVVPITMTLDRGPSGNWRLNADYNTMNPEESIFGDTTTRSKTANGKWIINLLIAPREKINFTELKFNQGGSNTGAGRSDATYNTNLNAFLNKIPL